MNDLLSAGFKVEIAPGRNFLFVTVTKGSQTHYVTVENLERLESGLHWLCRKLRLHNYIPFGYTYQTLPTTTGGVTFTRPTLDPGDDHGVEFKLLTSRVKEIKFDE